MCFRGRLRAVEGQGQELTKLCLTLATGNSMRFHGVLTEHELFEEVQQPSLTCCSCDVKPKAHQCRCHNAVAEDVADVTVAQCPCRQSLVAHSATPKANNQREERKGQCWQQPRRRGVLETAQKLAHLVVRQCPAKLPDHEHEDLRQTDTADQLCNSEEFIQLRWQQTFLSQDLGLVEPLLRMQANLATDWDEEACPTQKSP
mmetsp:Transcript_98725/g.235238  ORF Transcript_98725/g.235238 Transcript_98725/m.235238 type:complete len:202 (+) Transcript_98725:715-1320(+)